MSHASIGADVASMTLRSATDMLGTDVMAVLSRLREIVGNDDYPSPTGPCHFLKLFSFILCLLSAA
jgi:hypothetical protein